MEIQGQPKTAIQIPCCLCGTLIFPNAANQCGACLAQQFDLKHILQRGNLTIYQCRECRRYEHTDTYFCHHEPESATLLALCLKNIPALSSTHTHRNNGISSLTILDSMWIWTEPHSMRLKIRLTIRAEVGESPRCVSVQQRLPIEFYVKFRQCPDCNREYTNRTWQAIVQLRQKRSDDGAKKGLVMLEVAIARNADVRKHILKVETSRNGFDFYFMELMHAQAFSSFLSSVYPMKVKTTQKLVSEDRRNNTANIKHTFCCDMVPLSRDDLIVCDKRAARDGCSAGKLSGRMCLVNKVSGSLQLVDAAPPRYDIEDVFTDLHPEKYWKGEKHYRIVFSSKRLVRFVVMDVELCEGDSHHRVGQEGRKYAGGQSNVSKYALADVTVSRESEFGQSDETFHCTTHLGNIIDIGDVVLGYDLVSSVLTGGDQWSMDNSFNSSFQMPDVVLVKKDKRGLIDEIPKDEKSGKKSKSSGSKRREKRQRKQENKMKELSNTYQRMGLGGGRKDDDEQHSQEIWDERRKAFELELEKDTELAEEFRSIVEKEITTGKAAAETTASSHDDTNANENNDEAPIEGAVS